MKPIPIPIPTPYPKMTTPNNNSYLSGGRKNAIEKINNTVHRPAGLWSTSVHALLTHLQQQGFTAAPTPLGFDDHGREILSYLPGDIAHDPLTPAAASPQALTSAAQLLRQYHDASATFLAQVRRPPIAGNSPPRQPAEVICHGDFAPYNTVLNGRTTVAIIDFDTAHPAPRLWDLAYALYRWAPFTHAHTPHMPHQIAAQTTRARLFCDTYGLPTAARHTLPTVMIERLQALVTHMTTEAANGNETFQANIDDGHHTLYLTDITYIETHRTEIIAALV